MALVGYYDTVLVSGDGDLAYVNAVSYQGSSGWSGQFTLTSDSLFNVADRYMISIWLKKISKTRSVDASVNTSGIGYREESDIKAFCFS